MPLIIKEIGFILDFFLIIISSGLCNGNNNQTNTSDFSDVQLNNKELFHPVQYTPTKESFTDSDIQLVASRSMDNLSLYSTSSNDQNITISYRSNISYNLISDSTTLSETSTNNQLQNDKTVTQKYNQDKNISEISQFTTIKPMPLTNENISVLEEAADNNSDINQDIRISLKQFETTTLNTPVQETTIGKIMKTNVTIELPENDTQTSERNESKGNITGVGIKTTVSVSLHLRVNNSDGNATKDMFNSNQQDGNVTGDQELTSSCNNASTYNDSQTSQLCTPVVKTDLNLTDETPEVNKTASVHESSSNISLLVTEITTRTSEEKTTLVLSTQSVTENEVLSSTEETTIGERSSSIIIMPTENVTKSREDVTFRYNESSTETVHVTETKMSPSENLTSTDNEASPSSTPVPSDFNVTTEITKLSNFTSITTTPQPLIKLAAVMKISNGLEWKPQFTNRQSIEYKAASQKIRTMLEDFYNQSTPLGQYLQEILIDGFSEGSVIVDYFLILRKAEPPDIDYMVHLFNSNMKLNNYTFEKFVIDPKDTKFEVDREPVIKPIIPASTDPPVPQWVIAVIVVAAASFIFLILFSAVTIYGRHHGRRKYSTKLQDEDAVFDTNDVQRRKLSHVAYENLAADVVYDVDKTTTNTGRPYDSWRTDLWISKTRCSLSGS